MAEKRHGKSKEKYSVILLDILPNSIQIAISKDFAEDLTQKLAYLRATLPDPNCEKLYDGR